MKQLANADWYQSAFSFLGIAIEQIAPTRNSLILHGVTDGYRTSTSRCRNRV